MKCTACDTMLNDFELSRKYISGDDVNLCNDCFAHIKADVDATANINLMTDADDIEYREAEELRYLVDSLTEYNEYDEYNSEEY